MPFVVDIQGRNADELLAELNPFFRLMGWSLPTAGRYQAANFNLNQSFQQNPVSADEQARLTCLFHALAHFGQGTPLRHGTTRNDYFRCLHTAAQRLNLPILKPYTSGEKVEFIINGRCNVTLDLGVLGGGYTSVIPLTADAARRYFNTGEGQISQFEFGLEDIPAALQPGQERHLYLQAVTQTVALDQRFPGTRCYMRENKEEKNTIFHPVLKQMANCIAAYLPATEEDLETFPAVWLYCEVYNDEFIKECLKRYEILICPSGNVLNGGGRKVTAVAATGSVTPNDSVGVPVQGTYGWLTMSAEGDFDYVIDDGQPGIFLNQLKQQSLVDEFVYEISDLHGNTSREQLKIPLAGDFLNKSTSKDGKPVYRYRLKPGGKLTRFIFGKRRSA